ncbi:beta-mannosidase [Gordonia rubripertincta]|nr:beta-mannosidase [Gordonia rubripertincta]
MIHRRTFGRAVRTGTTVLIVTVFVLLIGLSGGDRDSAPHAGDSTRPRVRATSDGLTLDGKPWWPVGFNAYQLGTDWSVNVGCGAEVDLDAYFAALPPGALTRFDLYSSFASDKHTGLLNFEPLDRVFEAAKHHAQLVLPVLAGGSGDCEDGRFKERAFYVDGWLSKGASATTSRGHLTYAQWVETAVSRWRDESSIVGWELVGEPEPGVCGRSCDWRRRVCPGDATAVLRSFFDRAGAHLRSFDDSRPIFSGLVGGDQCGIAGDGYLEVARSDGIDVLDFHDYSSTADPAPGPQGSDLSTRIDQARRLGKPLVVNEVGIEAGSCLSLGTRARRVDAAMSRRREAGVAGVLLWSFVPDPRTSECTYDIGPHDPAWDVLRAKLSQPEG